MAILSERVREYASNPLDRHPDNGAACCVAFVNNRLVQVPEPSEPPSQLAQLIHDQFRALVLSAGFSCLGAQAAIRAGRYRMGIYGELGLPDVTRDLAAHLSAFVEADDPSAHSLTTFVASFSGPAPTDELEFERLLWAQLQALHDQYGRDHRWDPSVSSDPEDASFSFSFAGRAFFVVGLHAASSRWARRFAWPTLVFNPHHQFKHLRQQGTFARLQARIRARELALQGTLNVNLSEFGERPEARQYAGRPVEDAWQCPFQARNPNPEHPLESLETAVGFPRPR